MERTVVPGAVDGMIVHASPKNVRMTPGILANLLDSCSASHTSRRTLGVRASRRAAWSWIVVATSAPTRRKGALSASMWSVSR